MLKLCVVSAISLYLGAGLFAGIMMQRAIPAINPVGIALIAITWPNQVRCARVSSGCDPIPELIKPYIFSFPPVLP